MILTLKGDKREFADGMNALDVAGSISQELKKNALAARLDGEVISAEDQETAMEMLAEIKEKIIQEKKPSVIKSALIGLKDFLIGVGASATVAVVDAKTKGLF